MRLIVLALLAYLITSFQPSHAQGGNVSPILLVGNWTVSERMPNGATMTTDLSVTQNMKFSGVAKVQGKEFWSYSGAWEVNGRRLTWHYENSTRHIPESAKTDIDDIVSVDAERLVLASQLSGKQHVYLRAK